MICRVACGGIDGEVDETFAERDEQTGARPIQVNGTASMTRQTCMSCGVCVDSCPQQALSLLRDEAKGTPLNVRLLKWESAGLTALERTTLTFLRQSLRMDGTMRSPER